jgi:hypothetical protein
MTPHTCWSRPAICAASAVVSFTPLVSMKQKLDTCERFLEAPRRGWLGHVSPHRFRRYGRVERPIASVGHLVDVCRDCARPSPTPRRAGALMKADA